MLGRCGLGTGCPARADGDHLVRPAADQETISATLSRASSASSKIYAPNATNTARSSTS